MRHYRLRSNGNRVTRMRLLSTTQIEPAKPSDGTFRKTRASKSHILVIGVAPSSKKDQPGAICRAEGQQSGKIQIRCDDRSALTAGNLQEFTVGSAILADLVGEPCHCPMRSQQNWNLHWFTLGEDLPFGAGLRGLQGST